MGKALKISDLQERPAISVDELAGVLGIGRASAYAMANRGEIPVVRVGPKRIVVPTAGVLRLLGVEPIDRDHPASA